MRRLDVNLRDFYSQTDSLSNLLVKVSNLDFETQRIIYELVMVRLFSLLELQFESIILKVLCNTQYLDASYPNLIITSSNARNAISNISNHGRTRPLRNNDIKWNQYQCILGNVRHLINSMDNLLSVFSIYERIINEMRLIRNHIAHNTPDTRNKYKSVVISYYGAYVNSLTPGKLLISNRRSPCLLKQYIITARIIVKDLIKA